MVDVVADGMVSLPVAALVGIAVVAAMEQRSLSRAVPAGVAIAVVAWRPAPAVGAVLVVAPIVGFVAAMRSVARRHARRTQIERDVTLLGELVGLGLGAGLTFAAALRRAAAEVGPALQSEVTQLLRRANEVGLSSALVTAQGHARALYSLAGRAVATGAPLAAAVASFVSERRRAERARALVAARKLPVRLLFPLALLILPGFVVLTLGPAMLGAVERLQFSLPSVVGRLPT